MHKKTSLIMLACNKSHYTSLSLNGLLQSDWENFEFILVDNGSVDNTAQVFAEFSEKAEAKGWSVKTIRNEENVGAVEGRNQALRQITGDYVVFMDNDIVIGQKSWLKRMTAELEADPQIGILGPKILFAEKPNNIQCAGCEVSKTGRVNFRGRGQGRQTPEFNERIEAQCLISACWIKTRKLVDQLGELDMQFHPVQFEDIDYCYRARDAGYKVIYSPCTYMYHFENVTTDGTSGLNYTYLTVKNGLKFKKKWKEFFLKEKGVEDASIEWMDIPHVSFEDAGEVVIDD